MSNVQTSAPRERINLDHFLFTAGNIGRLKVLNTIPVVAGDSFEMDLIGSFRLSPLRRGIVIDSHVDVFSFYIPHRHTYGQEFVDMLKAGIPRGSLPASLGVDAVVTPNPANNGHVCDFLGTHTGGDVIAGTRVLPKYFYQSYLQIWNNYFKIPGFPDRTSSLASLQPAELKDGFRCSQLDSIWTKPLPSSAQEESFVDTDDGLDIIGLQAAYAKLHTQQERDYFMQRYREVVRSFGGSTTYDADNRPHLLMRSQFWGSGSDVEGTTQDTLGQFAGRVQQSFAHSVPRFYVPEHGVIMTLALPRFPVIHFDERHYLTGKGYLNYYDLANDPALVGNLPPREIPIGTLFASGFGSDLDTIKIAEGQWYRTHPSYVDRRYRDLQGYPFLSQIPTSEETAAFVNDNDYTPIFQTTQLGQWNIQSKANVSVLRSMPTARDSIMTS